MQGLQFRTSSKCDNSGGSCVEFADLADGGVAFRDSKQGDGSPVLFFTDAEREVFVAGVKAGDLDR